MSLLIKRPTICIARLRSGVNYAEPLRHIMCHFYVVLRKFVQENADRYRFTYYNFGFGERPKRDLAAIEAADVVIIPSEAEWTYHVPGLIHSLDLKRSNDAVDKLKPLIEGKHIIVLRDDRCDDEQMYRTRTFPGVRFDYSEIDANDDLPPTIFGVKYYSIKSHIESSLDLPDSKEIDFVYWGTRKNKLPGGSASHDIRHVVLKQIKLSALSSVFVGQMHGFKRDSRFTRMVNLVPLLQTGRATLCFSRNWHAPGDCGNAVTTRYFEAAACGVVPLVWRDYDAAGVVVADDWQRCASVDDVIKKVDQLRRCSDVLSRVVDKLERCLPSVAEYEAAFAEKLFALICQRCDDKA